LKLGKLGIRNRQCRVRNYQDSDTLHFQYSYPDLIALNSVDDLLDKRKEAGKRGDPAGISMKKSIISKAVELFAIINILCNCDGSLM